jgi:hypothetical protein
LSAPLGHVGEGHPHHAVSSSPHHSYFETSGAQHSKTVEHSPAHTIPSIPEGVAVRPTAVTAGGAKSPSSAHSSAPTTGTTTTPTSLGNTYSPGEGKGPGPEFSREGLTSQAPSNSYAPHYHHQHPTNIPGDASSWPSMGAPPQGAMYHPSGPHYGGGVSVPSAQQPPPQYSQQEQQQSQQQQSRYNPANYPAAIKLLVSNNVAGSIIGRAGQTISELQKQSSTRIKLSQTGDYYPGTQDRVCLVQGEPEHCNTALRLLLERLHMLQEHQHSQHMAWQLQRQKGAAPSFDFVVRLLVPLSSCGMIIGKSGSNIKFMEETTGVSSVRLSPKESGDGGFTVSAMMPPTSERVVTVTGPTMESCLNCVCLVLEGMVSHPDICRYSNMTTSYSRAVPGVVPDAYPGAARSVLVSVPPTANMMSPQEQPTWEGMPPANPFSPQSEGPRRIVSSPDLPAIMLNPRLHGLPGEPQTPDRLGGYAVGVVPPPSPYSTLPVPGLPGTGGGLQQLYLIPQPQRHFDSHANDGHHVGHSVSAPDLLALQLEQSMHLSSSGPPPPPQPTSPNQDYADAFLPHQPTMIAPGCFNAQVLVPDSMIGSILGRGGSTLTELETLSGTRIRASQRGEFVPGTRSRIVTIRGPTAQSVWQAQFMMSQRMVLPPTAAYSPTHHQAASISEHHTTSVESKNKTDSGTGASHPPSPS